MKIETIRLVNFFNFEKTTINFRDKQQREKQGALFVGVNASGKSNILRAIAFFVENYRDDQFIRGRSGSPVIRTYAFTRCRAFLIEFLQSTMA